MNCLELSNCNHFNENLCQNKIMENKEGFTDLIQKTRECVSGLKDGEDDLQCETASLSAQNLFTFHTHPNDVREPSEVDRKTTKSMNKDYLCIGMANSGEIVCWHKSDGYKKEVFSF